MPKEFLNIRNASKSETIIDVDEAIGPYIDWERWEVIMDNTYSSLKNKLKDIPQSASHTIKVNIDNNLGGYLKDGLTMHDLLAEHKSTKVTTIHGYCASAATVLAQCASKGKRRMSSNAFYLIHRAMNGTYGNANELREMLKLVEDTDNILAKLYAKRSGKDVSVFEELMDRNNGNGVWLNADEALEYGLIDQVFEPNEKAVNMEGIMNLYSKDKNLPPLPTNLNSPDMTIEEALAKFKNDMAEMIKNIGKAKPSGEDADKTIEVKILDNEAVTNLIAGMEAQIKNTVSKEDHDVVVNAKNDLDSEKSAWGTKKTELENKITNLEGEVAKLKGTKTPAAGGGDPNPSGGGTKKTQNQINAEKNAAAFHTA
jgi:ATP-dependent protease ClpP protease subunit